MSSTPYPNAKDEVRALFFDIDGTLLNSATNHIPRSAITALNNAKKAGYHIYCATGRHASELSDINQLSDLPIDGFITSNGQYCKDGDKLIYTLPIPKNDLTTLHEYSQHNNIPCLFATDTNMYITQVNDLVRHCYSYYNLTFPPIAMLDDYIDIPIFHIGLYCEKSASTPDILKDLKNCTYTTWMNTDAFWCVDIIPNGGGKWNGVVHMAEHLGLHPSEVMTFGDNDNDIDMLENAKYSVAMQNGTNGAKKAAGYTTQALDDDGIAKALNYLLGISME